MLVGDDIIKNSAYMLSYFQETQSDKHYNLFWSNILNFSWKVFQT